MAEEFMQTQTVAMDVVQANTRVTFKGERKKLPGSKFFFPFSNSARMVREERGNCPLLNLFYDSVHTHSLSCVKFIVLLSKKAKLLACGASSSTRYLI